MRSPALFIRPSVAADLDGSQEIRALTVAHRTRTFALDAPDAAEKARRRHGACAEALAWLVAEKFGPLLGQAHGNHSRPRAACRCWVEDSIHFRPHARGRGTRPTLLAERAAPCEAAGTRRMLAMPGDGPNHGAIGVHRGLGLQRCGQLESVGRNFGRWRDLMRMQRLPGRGAHSMPAGGAA